jgi:hypothetical protein
MILRFLDSIVVLLTRLYNDLLDRITYVKQFDRRIADHKRICIDYVEKQKKLIEGLRKMEECRAFAADRKAYIYYLIACKFVPDRVERELLYSEIWKEYIHNPNRRCDWCENQDENYDCLKCLRNQPEPVPLSMEEINKLVHDVDVMLKAYREKVAS